jgi:hypothetical protein
MEIEYGHSSGDPDRPWHIIAPCRSDGSTATEPSALSTFVQRNGNIVGLSGHCWLRRSPKSGPIFRRTNTKSLPEVMPHGLRAAHPGGGRDLFN